jgi:signal transduction histidine kinase
LIEDTVAICRGEIVKKIKSFEVNVPVDLPMLHTDPEAIEQILLNHLINAAQASDKKDSHLRLDVKLKETGPVRLIIEVSDNGCGMDESTKKRIFDPFFTTKQRDMGTGLGLYVCHNLVEGLGGRINVESKPGEGSTFRIILPFKEKGSSRLTEPSPLALNKDPEALPRSSTGGTDTSPSVIADAGNFE